MPHMASQTAKFQAFEAYKKKVIPIKFTAKVPRTGAIGKNHIQNRFSNSKESVLFFCSESNTFLGNYKLNLDNTQLKKRNNKQLS